MRKLHWYQNERTACRPHSAEKLRRDPASKVSDVTCQPCIKALGLSPIVFRCLAGKAKLILRLPNGKRPVCLLEAFELKVEAAPTIDPLSETTAKSFIGKEPEPIGIKATLTEDGWSALREAMIRK